MKNRIMAEPVTVSCKTCDSGVMARKRVHRMSAPVVVIGYILLVPSFVGIAGSVGIFVLSLLAAGDVPSPSSATVADLRAKGVPREIISELSRGEIPSAKSKEGLSLEQRGAISKAQLEIVDKQRRTNAVSIIGCGTTLAAMLGIASLVGGLLGWLLIMKRTILQCDRCAAIVAAA